jgi:hypothetical protein
MRRNKSQNPAAPAPAPTPAIGPEWAQHSAAIATEKAASTESQLVFVVARDAAVERIYTQCCCSPCFEGGTIA